MRTLLALGILTTSIATAAPAITVSTTRRALTTEPAPPTPILTRRTAPPATAIIDVIAASDLCAGGWSAAVNKGVIELGQTADRTRVVAGTCAMRLTIRNLPAGTWELRLGAAPVTATLR
ncbi:MAG: hypothetical protein H0T46_13460 [Deltaproteobacteria bacterium]|nr:hypothetical protein [Deltaproteobacteria bacterium]